MDCMVLSQFFPSCGIDGVSEEAVYGGEVDVLRDALDASFNEEVLFHRLVDARGRARDWFLPGDVVWRRLGLDEERSDVLRRIQDKVYAPSLEDSSSYEDELESLRREAIEHHRWKVHRCKTWCSVIDPQGRAIVVAHSGAFRQWRKVMEQLVPRYLKSKSAATPVHRASAAWCSLKAVHRLFMSLDGAEIPRRDLLSSDYLVWRIYKRRLEMGRFVGTGRTVKMRKFRGVFHQPFWDRCFEMLESGDSVPLAVRHVYEHPSTKWVAISIDDAEWLLGCSWWDEWKKQGPVRFDKFKDGVESANRNWK